MVRLVRMGRGVREVARRFRVSPSTVLYWLRRASGQRLDRVGFEDRSHANRRHRGTPLRVVRRVLGIRKWLRQESALGEFGALAIRRELSQRKVKPMPSVRTIGYILERGGALDGRRRVRRPAPPRGWYLPDVREARAELDSWDYIEDLTIRGGVLFDVLNVVSLHGGLAGSWPSENPLARGHVGASSAHWRRFGLPGYSQFDNDTRFIGVIGYKDVLSRVVRHCMSLGVTPVFAPPREMGFQASVESFNARWQAAVWRRFQHKNMVSLSRRTEAFLAAYRRRLTQRIEAAPARIPFPKTWRSDINSVHGGRVIFLRRTTHKGTIKVLGHTCLADKSWIHRLVRAEVQLDHHRIQIYGLRRAKPAFQPLLNQIAYEWPHSKSRAH